MPAPEMKKPRGRPPKIKEEVAAPAVNPAHKVRSRNLGFRRALSIKSRPKTAASQTRFCAMQPPSSCPAQPTGAALELLAKLRWSCMRMPIWSRPSSWFSSKHRSSEDMPRALRCIKDILPSVPRQSACLCSNDTGTLAELTVDSLRNGTRSLHGTHTIPAALSACPIHLRGRPHLLSSVSWFAMDVGLCRARCGAGGS